MENWSFKKFKNVTKVITCGLAATPIYVKDDEGMPFFSAQNVQNGKVIYDNYKYISKELYNQITKHNKPEKGDILYTRVGAGIGEAGLIDRDFEFGIYVSLTLIRTDENVLYNGFLLHLLNSERYKAFAKRDQFGGGGVQNLNVHVVKEFDIPLPSLKEQKQIAKILNACEKLIDTQTELITAKVNRKKALMQKLLSGDVLFKGFEKTKWKRMAFKDVFEFISTNSFSRENLTYDNTTSEIHNIHYGDIHAKFNNEILDLSKQGDIPLIKDDVATGKKFSFLKNGDLIIADASEDYTGLGECVELANVGNKKVVGGLHVIVARDKTGDTIDGFRTYLFNNPSVAIELKKLATGVSVYSISKSSLLGLELLIPSTEEQRKIAKFFKAMDDELQLLNDELDEMRNQKRGLMQNLLTGKIRVKV